MESALTQAMEQAEDFEKAGKPEVPALALTLLAASIGETGRITDEVIGRLREDVEDWKARALQPERDARAVAELHEMLADPKYARRLIALLRSWEDDPG